MSTVCQSPSLSLHQLTPKFFFCPQRPRQRLLRSRKKVGFGCIIFFTIIIIFFFFFFFFFFLPGTRPRWQQQQQPLALLRRRVRIRRLWRVRRLSTARAPLRNGHQRGQDHDVEEGRRCRKRCRGRRWQRQRQRRRRKGTSRPTDHRRGWQSRCPVNRHHWEEVLVCRCCRPRVNE